MLLDTLKIFGSANYEVDLGVAYENMYQCFLTMNNKDSSFKYAQLALRVNDSLSALRLKNLSEFQQLSFAEQKRLEEIETERKNKTVRWTAYLFIIFSALIGFIAIILFRNARLRKKTNAILLQEKKTLETTLEQLKSTQVQLVQSEKMASLGELTAGIAHEIQNPLNFVNNFSEVSNELIDEMKTELDKGEITTAKEIAKDVKQNLEKITHHGKRADSIVKGMLQHSRSSTGQKELTDINSLCDEYLRLAYHGIRAKDSSFHVTLETDFDYKVGHVLIQPQEMGRVILNLINNALYAVGNKKNSSNTNEYTPIVKLTTNRKDKSIEISVADNGSGIPESIREKIFQPFFTTKPTGQGTGLGLSLSYDIVKAHGGSIAVESAPEKGTVFVIQIPVS
ncbi:MAG: GHKL domain-containing protein [Chitinophagaceae bacterium]|nr:GHKL domain-containing protein [Chitinophagaceae bacterium]